VLTDKFINLTLSGKLRLYGDVGGKTNLPKLSYGYYLLSEIYFAENNFVEALSAIQTAIGLNKDPNDRMFLLSGNIWFGLSNYRLAEESYFNAWSSGSANAKEKILLCYQITHNDTTGFEGYFLEKTKTDLTDNHRK
jgi:tetratricopeptide (TPR) repeat protein